jgi:RNA polymerase sigma-70 factor (ECF subfamily)
LPGEASPQAASGQDAVALPVSLSRGTGVAVARTSQDPWQLDGPDTNGAVSPQPGETAETSATRTEAPTEANGLAGALPDGSLLQRYVAGREEEAFTALVQRYERGVLSICQRVLGDAHAAQDAVQLTFLVLARKASMLDRQRPLAGWLFKVAYHLALRLRAVAVRQRRREKGAANGRSSEAASECSAGLEQQELFQAIREELQGLPDKYRVPLVRCYFDGQTHDEAARAIGLPRGSMAKRIGQGLEQLRERLLHRGFML